MPQLDMDAGVLGGQIHTEYSGIVSPNADGIITVDTRDGPALVSAGCMYLFPSSAELKTLREERAKAGALLMVAQDEEEKPAVAAPRQTGGERR